MVQKSQKKKKKSYLDECLSADIVFMEEQCVQALFEHAQRLDLLERALLVSGQQFQSASQLLVRA